MKKLNFFLVATFAMVAGLLTSCGNSTDPLTPPTITVEQVTEGDIAPESTVSYKITLGTSNGDLKTLEVKGTGTMQPAPGSGVASTAPADKWDSEKMAFVKGTASVTVNYDVVVKGLKDGDTFDISFTVTDEKDQTNEVTKTITIGGGTPVSTGTLKTNTLALGNQDSKLGSFAASFEGTVYTTSTAKANAASIDMLFFNGSTNGQTVFAPATAFAESIKTFGDLENWSVKNTTTFVKAAAADYNDATYESVETLAKNASAGKANNLAQGDVYAFKTLNGKSGIFMVSTLSTTDMSLSVKIQDQKPVK